jgi:hypothetical protein
LNWRDSCHRPDADQPDLALLFDLHSQQQHLRENDHGKQQKGTVT